MKKNQNLYTNIFTGNELGTYTPAAFSDLRLQYGLKPLQKKTKDDKKLKKQVENFSSRYICPFCNTPQTWVKNTNLMVCQNPKCSGKPIKSKDGTLIKYAPVYAQLNQRGTAIAETLLSE